MILCVGRDHGNCSPSFIPCENSQNSGLLQTYGSSLSKGLNINKGLLPNRARLQGPVGVNKLTLPCSYKAILISRFKEAIGNVENPTNGSPALSVSLTNTTCSPRDSRYLANFVHSSKSLFLCSQVGCSLRVIVTGFDPWRKTLTASEAATEDLKIGVFSPFFEASVIGFSTNLKSLLP